MAIIYIVYYNTIYGFFPDSHRYIREVNQFLANTEKAD